MFGLMKRSTHQYLYKKQGEAYRWQIREQQYEIEALKRNLTKFADIIVPEIHTEQQYIPHDRLMIMIEISAQRLRSAMPNEILRIVRDRIFERLNEFNKDYRPDLRQQDKHARLMLK